MFRSSKHGFREIFCFCTFVLSARPYATEGSSCPANWILFQGSCYFFSTHFTTWLAARELCRATGADLVTISSDFENAFVNSRLTRSSCLSHTAWLGLHRHPFNSSRWVWLDNFDNYPEYTKWHRKESMNDHLNKNCTSIRPAKSIFWYGTDCTAQGCFVCLRDANECNETDTCAGQPCENIPRSYRCFCGKGYEKTNKGTGCKDVDECQEDNGGCPHECRNIPGDYFCHCRNGFITQNNGTVCRSPMAKTSPGNENGNENHSTTVNNGVENLTKATESPGLESSDEKTKPAGSSDELFVKSSPLASFGVLFTMAIPLCFIVFFLILCYLKGPGRDKTEKDMGVSGHLIESVSPFLDTAFIDPEDTIENKKDVRKVAKRKNRTSDEDEHLV